MNTTPHKSPLNGTLIRKDLPMEDPVMQNLSPEWKSVSSNIPSVHILVLTTP